MESFTETLSLTSEWIKLLGVGGREEGKGERERERGRGREGRREGGDRERYVVIIYSSPLQLADHIGGSYQADRLWSFKDRSCQL